MDPKTVRHILEQPVEVKAQTRERASAVDAFVPEITGWLNRQVPVQRMLELAHECAEPFSGSRSEFYRQVARLRTKLELEEREAFVRFEGLPGEYCQVDWGEVRGLQFLNQPAGTRYFFCARLKWSRLSYVVFTKDMKLETLLRCLLGAFEYFGGVPWNCVFDNMKTVTSGRDSEARPIWNNKFLKLMVELNCHPLACWPESGNQKGAVENLVGWVKSNFIPERSFLNDDDLASKARTWVDNGNNSISRAHGSIPREAWTQREKGKLLALITTADDYGIAHEVQVGPESLVHIDANRYSVPVGHVGRNLLLRVRRHSIDAYWEDKLVAHHSRATERQSLPIIIPEHFDRVFEKKPRAQVMVYRDFLVKQDPSVASYISELCFRLRGEFGPHILAMYKLLEEFGSNQLGVACAIAGEHSSYGAEYLVSLLAPPRVINVAKTLEIDAPPQSEIDRQLEIYESFVVGSRG
jgi:transposase